MFEAIIINRIRKKISHCNQYQSNVNYESIINVLIIYEKSDIEKAIVLKSQLVADGKNCQFFCFDNSKNRISNETQTSEYSRNALNIFGFPKKKVVSDFEKISQNIDLLINISNFNYLSLSYLTLFCECKLKVGIKTNECNMYNFMIDVPKNIDSKFLSEQIMFYLRKLKSERKESELKI